MINFWASENAFFVVGFWTPIWMKHLFICRRENERKSACQTAESTTRTAKILLAPCGKSCKRIYTNVSRVRTHWFFGGLCKKSSAAAKVWGVFCAPCQPYWNSAQECHFAAKTISVTKYVYHRIKKNNDGSMPLQRMLNSKHLQVFSASNGVLTRTAGRPGAFIALVYFPCRIA